MTVRAPDIVSGLRVDPAWADNPDAYLVWSNEHRAWWAHSRGYARGLNDAGRYSRDEAIRICSHALMTAAHIGVISEVPVRLADLREVLKSHGGTVPAVILDGKLR